MNVLDSPSLNGSSGTRLFEQSQLTSQNGLEQVTDQFQHLLEESIESKEIPVLSSAESIKQRQDSLGPSIFAKIQEGNVDGLKLLAKFPEDFRLRDQEGDTLLGAALKEGKSNIISFLLEEDQKVRQNPATADLGLDANVKNNKGFTPLFQGYRFALNHNDDFEPLRLLLKREDLLINEPVILGANDLNLTILEAACELGWKEVVEDILAHPDIQVNRADKEGYTPILKAYQAQCSEKTPSHAAIVKILMNRPDINLAAKVIREIPGQNFTLEYSLLSIACLNGDTEIATDLIKNRKTFADDEGHLFKAQLTAYQSGNMSLLSLFN